VVFPSETPKIRNSKDDGWLLAHVTAPVGRQRGRARSEVGAGLRSDRSRLHPPVENRRHEFERLRPAECRLSLSSPRGRNRRPPSRGPSSQASSTDGEGVVTCSGSMSSSSGPRVRWPGRTHAGTAARLAITSQPHESPADPAVPRVVRRSHPGGTRIRNLLRRHGVHVCTLTSRRGAGSSTDGDLRPIVIDIRLMRLLSV
jgi:hypothetical protein